MEQLKKWADEIQSSLHTTGTLDWDAEAYHNNMGNTWHWKTARRLPHGVWLRKIKKHEDFYSLRVYIENMKKEVTVKAEGKRCPYDDLIAKIYVFL